MSEEEVINFTEQFSSHMTCYNCDFKGEFKGYSNLNDERFIFFICPECKGIEKVKNIFGMH